MLHAKYLPLVLIFGTFAVAVTEGADKDKTAIDLDLFFSKQQEIEGTLDDLLVLNGLVQKYKLYIEPSVNVNMVNAFEDCVASYHVAAKEYSSVLQSAVKSIINGENSNNSFLKLQKLSMDFELEPLNILKKIKSEFRQLFDVVYVLEVSINGYFNFKNTKETTELVSKYGDIVSDEVVRILQKYTGLLRTENSAEISEKLTMALIKEGKLDLSTAKDLIRHLQNSQKIMCTDLVGRTSETTKSSESKLSWLFSASVFGFNFFVVLGIYAVILKFLNFRIPQNIALTSLFSIFSLCTCYACAHYVSHVVELLPFFNYIYILVFLVGASIASLSLFYVFTILVMLARIVKNWVQGEPLFRKND